MPNETKLCTYQKGQNRHYLTVQYHQDEGVKTACGVSNTSGL